MATNRFICVKCNTIFPTVEELSRHVNINHGKDKIECDICGLKFSNKDSLRKHIKTHNYECGICNRQFHSEPDLRKHEKDFHPNNLACCECEKTFCNSRYLRTHMTVCTRKQPKETKTCKWCKKDMFSIASRTHHENICPLNPDNQDAKLCEHCGSRFKTHISLVNHINRSHTAGARWSAIDPLSATPSSTPLSDANTFEYPDSPSAVTHNRKENTIAKSNLKNAPWKRDERPWRDTEDASLLDTVYERYAPAILQSDDVT